MSAVSAPRIRLWYVEGGEYPDPPYEIGVFTTQSDADAAGTAFQKSMTNTTVPYKIWPEAAGEQPQGRNGVL
jgi:hypothetical protein